MKILLAEDEPAIARLIEFKLSKEGYEVFIARDGGEAVARLDGGPWNLVILDVMMPVMTGWQVLKEIRSREVLAAIPVILLSGKAEHAENSGLDARNTIRMAKPFDPEDLARTVRELLDGQSGGDADFEALKKEFLDTFPGRRDELVRGEACGDLLAIHVVVHRLAGAAASYGFPGLGSIDEALDDLLSAEIMRSKPDGRPYVAHVALLIRALEECHSGRGDCPRAAASPEAGKLTSDAESLPSEPMP